MLEYKNDIFRVRLTPSERKALETMAHMEGCSISDMFRFLIREGANNRELVPIGLLAAQQQKDWEEVISSLPEL